MRRGSALVCTYGAPRADSDSGSRRIMSHIRLLRELGWHVDFYAVNGAGPERYDRALHRAGVAVYDAETTSFEEIVASGWYDLALFAFWQTAEQHLATVRHLRPECRIVVDSVDLQLLRDARRKLGGMDGRLLGMDYAAEVVGELNVYAVADAVFTVSQKEADLINDLVGDPNRAFAVADCEDLARSPHRLAARNGIVFVGSFQHPPNASAVEFLCRDVLPCLDPDLRARHPASIVGAGLDSEVARSADAMEHVRIVGWVPSVISYLARARVSVVPLLYGAGTKRKLVQALMVGTPSVSTAVGVEGLRLEHGREVLVANDAASFAAAIEQLLTDNDLWQRLARDGRRQARSTHSRPVVRKTFLNALQTILSRPCRSLTLPEPAEHVYLQRLRYQTHQKIAPKVTNIVERYVPVGSKVVVMGEESSELLEFERRVAVPFPDGVAASGDRPPVARDPVELLEAAKADGAEYLLVPITARWRYMGSHPELAAYVARHERIAHIDDVCELYALRRPSLRWNVSERVDRVERLLAEPRETVPRLVAFYLPQFHPIPENDAWWGEGFTEWTNVARAEPLFEGHYQPHVPADLGFYDLRLGETRAAQAEMASQYGIAGFAWYHYWFSGKQLLERPFHEVLSSGEPDFPFLLCWANEPWSRRWHGREEDVLQAQAYSSEDDLAHIRWLLPALADPRAMTIAGRPIFVVYQARDLSDPRRTVETWRHEVTRAGLPDPYLMTVETGWDEGWNAAQVGFDAKIMFRPQFTILRRVPRIAVADHPKLEVYDYRFASATLSEPEDVPYKRYETVCPCWDNTPRTGPRGVVLHDSTPQTYEQWLTAALRRAMAKPTEERIIFINAWNEWGEGCHLEPDRRFGHAYLDATRDALQHAVRESVCAAGEMSLHNGNGNGAGRRQPLPALENR
jgi:glycosyltransferase involved in cell wall biosynthesis